MAVIGPTFFSSPSGGGGDHPPGDGLTRLQVRFNGGSSVDESPFMLGAGTITEAVVGNVTSQVGYARVVATNNGNNFMNWGAVGLNYTDYLLGYTVEMFVKILPFGLRPTGFHNFAHVSAWSSVPDAILSLGAQTSGRNELKNNQSTGYTWTDSGNDIYTRMFDYVHFAWVQAPGSSLMRAYVGGVQIGTNAAAYQHAGSGYVRFGPGSGGSSGGTPGVTSEWHYSGVRVRRAEMYDIGNTGIFTPPASPFDWGPP